MSDRSTTTPGAGAVRRRLWMVMTNAVSLNSCSERDAAHARRQLSDQDRALLREFGLSKEIGPVGYGTSAPQYLGEPALDQIQRPYSEQTQRIVDEEVSRLLLEAENRAIALLRAHRDALDRLAVLLVEHETVDAVTRTGLAPSARVRQSGLRSAGGCRTVDRCGPRGAARGRRYTWRRSRDWCWPGMRRSAAGFAGRE